MKPLGGTSLTRLISGLTPLELKVLKQAIVSPEKRKALVELIDSLLKVQADDHLSSESLEFIPELRSDDFLEAALPIDDKRAFTLLLSDREALPSIKDVVRVVNASFGTKFTVGDFQTRGRNALIEKAWKLFQNLSAQERAGLMNSIINRLPNSSKANNDYQRLFKFLTRNER